MVSSRREGPEKSPMIDFLDIGLKPYKEVLDLQYKLHAERVQNKINDTVIFCEHNPVYTIGKRECNEDWLSDLKTIARDGIDVVKTDRGGKITYHGPGQLIVYFIFDINKRKIGIKDFVHKIEGVCMETLAEFGINAVRDPEYPGLWVNTNNSLSPRGRGVGVRGGGGIRKKLVALGFHVSQGVTIHGIAINVSPNLNHYKHIIPCGIKGRDVTSMADIFILEASDAFLGDPTYNGQISLEGVKQSFFKKVSDTF